MKPTKFRAKNIGILEDVEFYFDKPLILFYGDIMQGKTTILDSIRFLAGGKAVSIPKNLIREGQNEAFIEILLENGRIKREFYRATDGSVKARALEASVNNVALNQTDVTSFFNPFLLDQNCFSDLNPIDKAKFLLKTFDVDTSLQDKGISNLTKQASELRAAIKAYGEIDVTPMDKPNLKSIESKGLLLKNDYDSRVKAQNESNEAIQASNDEAKKKVEDANKEAEEEYNKSKKDYEEDQSKEVKNRLNAKEYLSEFLAMGYEGKELVEFVDSLPLREDWNRPCFKPRPLPEPEPKNFDPVDDKELVAAREEHSNAKADMVRYEEYEKRLAKQEEKSNKESELVTNKVEQEQLKKEKATLLLTISNNLHGLVFDESGDFRYNGTTSDRLSDSQKMDLSSKLSSLYPDGLKIECIDRGESLGKSVMNLVDRAKSEDRTILVTIVNDAPAETPEGVGVFTVEQGRLKS